MFSNKAITDATTFKNSVFFTNEDNKLPYRYSGNGGYINGKNIKIAHSENSDNVLKVFNEYYIVGRDKDGNCRINDDINNYLYYYDAPILFNKNFTYSCKKASIDQNNVVLLITLFSLL